MIYHNEVTLDAPENVFLQVSSEVATILAALSAPIEDEASETARARIAGNLTALQAHVARQQKSLAENAEWQRFTVALYGETNAGKSTIIETLRILLGESTKLEQRSRFQALQRELRLSSDDFQALHRELEAARSQRHALAEKRQELDTLVDVQLAEARANLEVAEHTAVEALRNRAWWKKLLSWFRGPVQDPRIADAILRLQTLETQHADAIRECDAQVIANCEALARSERELDERTHLLPMLAEHADGAIVGDGRPDFTRATQRYEFSLGDVGFTLLDVPGIEGDETKVLDQIDAAVQTAHAVFYVTGKASPPQHGDKQAGTLEKIKRHLNAQTEVWAVYNKRVTAPFPLRSAGNLFEKDVHGLDALSRVLKDQLEEHYKGVITLSAYPAFLALADHLATAPDDNEADSNAKRNRERTKFLNEFAAPALLAKTHFSDFATQLHAMAQDAPRKIRRANFNKASQVLKDVIAGVRADLVEMEAHLRLLTRETGRAQDQVDRATQQLQCSLQADGDDAIRRFQSVVRERTYKRIEAGVANDALASHLREELEACANQMQIELATALEAANMAFQAQVAHVAKRFQNHVADLESMLANRQRASLNTHFSITLRIDHGVNVTGLVATVATIPLIFTGPPGWVAIALNAISAVVSVGKALWALVDPAYKKSQQRKAVDQELQRVRDGFLSSLRKHEEQLFAHVETMSTETRKQIGTPQRDSVANVKSLRASVDSLSALSSRLDTTMQSGTH
jgi:hypothetical protein